MTRRRALRSVRAAAAVLVGALTLAPAIPAAAAAAAPYVTLGAAARLPAGARALGSLPAGRSLDLGVVLGVRDAGALTALATAISTPGSPSYQRYLPPGAFARRFGAPRAAIARVAGALRRAGLSVAPVSANRLILPVRGSVARIERVFRTHLEGYRLSDGTRGWAAESAPQVPAALGGAVSAVLGLDDLVQPHARPLVTARPAGEVRAGGTLHAVTRAPLACGAARHDAASTGAWSDSQVASAYGLDNLYAKGDVAAGQTIALFELEPFKRADLATFDRCYFGVSHLDQVSSTAIDGYALSGAGTGEAILDVEDLSALAPAAHIIVYNAPNTTYGAIDAYNEIVSQDRANIVTTSWGECESALETSAPGAQQLENTLFEEAATEGQTVFAATGDTGSDDCASTPFSSTIPVAPYLSVDDPASQPFVVSVGGTTLSSIALPRRARTETVWNDGENGGGGGGGISQTWSAPAWQADSGVAGVLTSANRQLPDVSATADEQRGITVYSGAFGSSGNGSGGDATDAGWSTIGGTSSATPIWAAIAAEIAASGVTGTSCGSLPVRPGGADLGFIAPALYAIASAPAGYAGAFIDVTAGGNDVFNASDGSYPATPGFDLASGLGAPVVAMPSGSGLAADLCGEQTGAPLVSPPTPVISSISPPDGPSGGGTAITVTLAAPLPAGSRLSATLGGATATVLSSSGARVTLLTPPSPLAPGSPPFDGAGAVQLVLTASGSAGSASSLATAASVFAYVAGGAGGAAPVVSGVGPSGGSTRGGNAVTVYGSGFAPGATVSFGGVAARSVAVIDDHELRVLVPPRGDAACARGTGFDAADNCQVEVQVSEAAGTSPEVPILPPVSGRIRFNPEGVISPTPGHEVAPVITEYDYARAPHISRIRPNPGDARGIRPVTISGRGFSLNTFDWVNFGPASNPASEQVAISWISPGKVEIVPPPGPARALRGGVSVQSVSGLSNVVAFAYAKVPTVSGLSASSGPMGTRIGISGRDLQGVDSVRFVSQRDVRRFRSVQGPLLFHRSAQLLVVVVPPGLSGAVYVEPCSPTGCASPEKTAASFVYLARPTARGS